MQGIATAAHDTGPAAAYYSRFHAAVARAQLTAWLAELPRGAGAPRAVGSPGGRPSGATLIDISGPGARAAEAALPHLSRRVA